MEYARYEARFASGGWSSGTLIAGLICDPAGIGARDGRSGGRAAVRRAPLHVVRGVAVRADDGIVTHTLLRSPRRRDALPAGACVVGDASTRLPDEAIRLVRGMAVRQGRARVGSLRAVWCDRATGRLMHILVRPVGGIFKRQTERVVSAGQIAEFASDGIALTASPIFAELPPYRPDAAISADARAALSGVLLAPSARRSVNLRIEDGVAHLSGELEAEEQVTGVHLAVQGVRGMRGLVVDLVAAESLGDRVEQALAATLAANNDEGALADGLGGVRVLCEHGIVYLRGVVLTRELSAALEHAARAVAGVRVVVNQLTIEVDPQRLPARANRLPEAARVTADSGPQPVHSRARASSARLPTPR